MKLLEQPCHLCRESPVRYVKTNAGFFKVCARCEKVLKEGGILIEPHEILLMSKHASAGEGASR